jgi:hypothetical protein
MGLTLSNGTCIPNQSTNTQSGSNVQVIPAVSQTVNYGTPNVPNTQINGGQNGLPCRSKSYFNGY